MSEINSNRLKEKKEYILTLWKDRCLKEVLSAETVTVLALRNSLPIYLDHLSEALATNRKMDFKSVFNREEEAARIGKMHGADRAANLSYELTEVIFEYHILREVIFHVLEMDGPLQELPRDIILDSIEQAVNDAAVRFSEIHSEIQQKFVNTLTHDLKNPIAAAKMNVEIMVTHHGLSDPAIKSSKKVVANLNRLESMIHDLLDGSRVRAGGQLALQFLKCDLSFLLREVIEEMRVIHGDRFQAHLDDSIINTWSHDGLRRAVENLIDNAVKYSTPESTITVTLTQTKVGAEIIIHNEGKPIPEREVPLLFLQYRRSKVAEASHKMGWGLGLTLVKAVMEAHHGNIRVESAEGKGTSFILEIPFPIDNV